MSTSPSNEFDYIIVGGGSAGCVLASRLSEDPAISVCLLEAGGKDTHPLIHIPFGLSLLSRVKSVNWGYETTPQAGLNHRKLYWPRGKTLGGSSSINAMCYIRGQYSDYDDWAAAGATGWSATEVLPWFKKAEHYFAGEDTFHGRGGPLQVNQLRHVDELSKTFIKAGVQYGLSKCEDFNRDSRVGVGLYHVTQHNGQRWSAAQAYLSDTQKRANLHIKTQIQVNHLQFCGTTAKRVEVLCKGELKLLHARHEIILSAGAINSPQLLLLSGIGPEKELDLHNIKTRVNLPGVGKNLQDHLDAIVQYKTKSRHGYAVAASALPGYFNAAIQYLLKREGMLSSNIAEAGGFACSSKAQPDKPDLQFHFLPARLNDHGRKTAFGYGFGLHVCNLYPRSRGEVTLQSPDPAIAPKIDPNYLSHNDDIEILVEGIKLARKILTMPAFDEFHATEWLPGPDITDEAGLIRFIRKKAETIYHPVGTCKMGEPDDETCVVDNQLRVIGLTNLRVVDASVIPTITGGNTHAPVVMIAERAAALILQRYRQSHSVA